MLKGVRLWLRTAGGFAVLSGHLIQDQQNQTLNQHDCRRRHSAALSWAICTAEYGGAAMGKH